MTPEHKALVALLRQQSKLGPINVARGAMRDAANAIESLFSSPTAQTGEAVAVKPLEWQADHGVAALGPYRLFQAETPLGRFVYGTDAEGSCYWHSASSGVFMVGDEATGKRLAEAAWKAAALKEAGKFVDLVHPVPAVPDAVEGVGLYGPFGWLNGCRGLSEDSWSLESDPLENSEEYFAIPLYAKVDPFREIGPLYQSTPSAASPVPMPDAVERAANILAQADGYQFVAQKHRDLASMVLAASHMPVGDDYVLAPKEPTEAMWQAGRLADEHPGDSYSKVWTAMLAASTGEAGR